MTEPKGLSKKEASARRLARYQARAKLEKELKKKGKKLKKSQNAHHVTASKVVARDGMTDSKDSGRGNRHGSTRKPK